MHWLPTRKILLYTVANPACGLNRKKKERKSLAAHPPPPPHPRALLARRGKKKITRRIHMSRRYTNRCYAGGLGCAFHQTTGENFSEKNSELDAANVASNRRLRQRQPQVQRCRRTSPSNDQCHCPRRTHPNSSVVPRCTVLRTPSTE